MGLDTKNLSRTLEDAGTIIEPLVPWTAAGIYMAHTLNVPTSITFHGLFNATLGVFSPSSMDSQALVLQKRL